MTDRHPEWSSMPFKGKYLGIFRLPGGSWRYLRAKREKKTFATAGEAEAAARQRALDILFPAMRGPKEPTDAQIADKLGLTDWLRSKREDVQKQQTMHRAGKRQVIVLSGRAG